MKNAVKYIAIITAVITAVIIASCGGQPPSNPGVKVCDSYIYISDPVFRDKVAKSMGTDQYGNLCRCDAERVTTLDISGTGRLNDPVVTNLSGIENFINLTTLKANYNRIVKITPLIANTKLTHVELTHNYISELWPLTATPHTSITELDLGFNCVQDISPLSGLTGLRILGLARNGISSLAPISGLSSLEELYLDDNLLVDISPVAGKPFLKKLYLSRNDIFDISPAGGLGSLEVINLYDNPRFSNLGPLSGLQYLRHVDVEKTAVSGLGALIANPWIGPGDEVAACDTMLVYTPDASGIKRNADVETLRARWVKVFALTAGHNPIMQLPGYYTYTCAGVSGVAGVDYQP